MKFSKLLLTMFGCLLLASAAQAASVTLNDCDAFGCEGSTLFLEVTDNLNGTFSVTYTINTDNYDGNQTGFNQIGFKAIKDWTSATLLSAPSGLGNWSDVIEAPINSNSLCGNAGQGDKLCVFAENSLVDITGGGDYTWTFLVVGGTLLPEEDWHLGAQYADAVGPARGHIISAPGGGDGIIPEPSAALLFGVGALFVGGHQRRR